MAWGRDLLAKHHHFWSAGVLVCSMGGGDAGTEI